MTVNQPFVIGLCVLRLLIWLLFFLLSRRNLALSIWPINSSMAMLDGAHNRIRILFARCPFDEPVAVCRGIS